MTIDGYLAARVVEGSFDSQEFYDFVAEDVQFYSESWDQLPTDSDHYQPEW
ncbi:hypothetical protein AZE42_03733, partial [Rhizopogon vesiculosus]